VDHEEIVRELLLAIQKSVGYKLRKSYELETFLAVVIDDYTLDLEFDLPKVHSFVGAEVSKPALENFAGLFILGASGKTFFQYGEMANY